MSLEELRGQLARWTSLEAPTGFEEPVLRTVRDELIEICGNAEIDVRGNVYAELEGTDPDAVRVMITAHADEIGFMVTSLLPGGFVRFTRLGGPTHMVLPGQRVRLLASSGAIEGVIGVKPGHILSGADARQLPPIEEMYIDIGAENDLEAAEWGLEPGTPGVFVGELVSTKHPTRVFGKSIDNRAGIVAVLELARRIRSTPCRATCQFVIVVEEEIGLRGAEVATRTANPDVVLAIDTVPSGGTPDLADDQLPWEIGAGPLLKVRETQGLSTHGPLRELFRAVADEHEIPYQLIVDTAGITDATSAQQASGSIAAMTLGLARRYSHSAVEMLDLRDLEALIEWVERAVPQLDSRERLMRI